MKPGMLRMSIAATPVIVDTFELPSLVSLSLYNPVLACVYFSAMNVSFQSDFISLARLNAVGCTSARILQQYRRRPTRTAFIATV